MNEDHPPVLSAAPDGRPWKEQPAWRREVPLDLARERQVHRRSFLRTAAATSCAIAGGSLIAGWLAPPTSFLPRPIARPDQLEPGESLIFTYPDDHQACILVRTGRQVTDHVAYRQACTHLQCPVIPQPEQDRLYCPCHHGAFNLQTGRPLFGPPRRPLPTVLLEFTETAIIATGVEATG